MRRAAAILVLATSIAGLSGCGGPGAAAAPQVVADANTVARAAASGQNAVEDWATIVLPAITNPGEPRPPVSSEVVATTIHLAVYDAVVAIEGGYQPYAKAIEAPRGASLRAAIATAAYRTARGRVAASQFAYLDQKYGDYLADIPGGPAKDDGVQVGGAAAAGVLALRAHDGFADTVAYTCSAKLLPMGEFQPNGGCGTEPVDAKIARVKPFTFSDPAQFRPHGPDRFASPRWVRDFNEVKAYGRADSAVRTPEQTDLVYFWSEHAYVFWTRNLVALAFAKHLDEAGTARLFAMAHTAASDASIAGFEAKYFYRSWRPRTAIPRATEDGNAKTASEQAWSPLLTVNHPEYPSGHGFFSTALTDAVAEFFGTRRMTWTLVASKNTVPQLVRTERTYQSLDAVMRDISDARVWAGLHFRNSMRQGGALGDRVEKHVMKGYFRPIRSRDDASAKP